MPYGCGGGGGGGCCGVVVAVLPGVEDFGQGGEQASASYLGHDKPDSFPCARTRHPIPGETRSADGRSAWTLPASKPGAPTLATPPPPANPASPEAAQPQRDELLQ